MIVVLNTLWLSQVDCEVGAIGLVIHEVVFDDVALVSKTHDEFLQAVCCIHFHDVPQDRPVADHHHRFRFDVAFLVEPGPQTATKDHHRRFIHSFVTEWRWWSVHFAHHTPATQTGQLGIRGYA